MQVQNCQFFNTVWCRIRFDDGLLEDFISVFGKIIDHVHMPGRTISRYHVQPHIHFILHIHACDVIDQVLQFVPRCWASMAPLPLEVVHATQ